MITSQENIDGKGRYPGKSQRRLS